MDEIKNAEVLGDYLLGANNTESDKFGVITVTSDPGGCGFYRIHQPYKVLRSKFDINWSDNLVTDDFNTDVVVIQRGYSVEVRNFVKHVKANRKDGLPKFLLELDDDVLSVPEENDFYDHYSDSAIQAGYREMMQIVDAVTVSTEYLADVVRKHTEAPVFVLPNRVPNRLYNAFTERSYPWNRPSDQRALRMLWSGSPTHRGDIDHMVAGITKYLQRYPDAELHLMGADYSDLFPKNMKKRMAYHGWVAGVTEYHKLLVQVALHCDVMLAPLDDNRFNKSKSNLRLIEAGAIGLPAVASNVGPYSGWTPGSYQVDDDNWFDALVKLTKDKATLPVLSEGGRAWVTSNYLSSDGAGEYMSVLETIKNL